jgi:hypothetical protein
MRFINYFILFLLPTSVFSQIKSEEIVAKYFTAVGGVSAWTEMNEYAIESENHQFLNGIEQDIDGLFIEKKPNLFYSKTNINGVTYIMAYDGNTLWQQQADKEPKPVVGYIKEKFMEANFRFAGSLITYLFIDYKNNGSEISDFCEEKMVDNKPYFEVILRNQSFNPYYYYFSKDTYLLKARCSEKIDSFEKATSHLEFFDDYRKIGNILIPFLTETYDGGQLSSKKRVKNFEPNKKDINSELFKFQE